MKNLFFFVTVICLNISSNAQTIYPVETYFDHSEQNNIYFKDVNMIFSKYVGVWEYSTSNEYFKIEFFKVTHEQEAPDLLKLTRYWDTLKSRFQYRRKINSVWTTIYDTFNEQSGVFYISGNLPESFSVMKMNYLEPPTTGNCRRIRSADLTLVFTVTDGPKLQWTRVDREKTGVNLDNPCPDGSPRDASEFQIPAQMILSKVN